MKRNALAASLAQALFCAALLPASLAATAQNQAPDAGTARVTPCPGVRRRMPA